MPVVYESMKRLAQSRQGAKILCALAGLREPLLLLGRNRLRQRPHDGGDDVAVHQFLADAPLVAIRLAERLERLPAPVLPDREVDTDRRFRELAGANLVRVGPRL